MEKHSVFIEYGSKKYKKSIYLFSGAGFFAGIFLANTFFRKTLVNLGVFGDYFFMQIERVTIEGNAMFLHVFEKRMLFVMILVIAAVTSMGTAIVYAVSVWIGLSAGVLLSTAAMQQGMEGIGICLAGLLPQYLLYIPAGIMLMLKSCQISDRIHGKEQRYTGHLKKDMPSNLGKFIAVFFAFFVGILMESYLNPIFLQKIYKIFNNI